MKHTMKITLYLMAVFLLAQFIGLLIINEYIDVQKTAETGKTVIVREKYDVTGIQPPEIENESMSFIYIAVAVFIGTILLLLIIRYKKKIIWKYWFFLVVVLCLIIAFSPFLDKFFKQYIDYNIALPLALLFALVLAYYKVFKPNIYAHNFSELFIYGGLAALLVPILNLFSVVVLLLLISGYDVYAVLKSKHMVKMAKFQTQSKVFAGVMFDYAMPEKKGKKKKKGKTRSAILGGGDVAFPLLFSGVVMKMTGSYFNPLITTLFAAGALFFLFWMAEKDKFYPAMPFITAGCLFGYGVVVLIGVI